MAVATPEPEPEVEAESAPVDDMYRHRVAALADMGFVEYAADLLASHGVSSSYVRESFVRYGCPRDVVLRILL